MSVYKAVVEERGTEGGEGEICSGAPGLSLGKSCSQSGVQEIRTRDRLAPEAHIQVKTDC